ncbi:MAG: hypothetical protein ACOC2L_05350 [Candidatus Sumerlaeota bacterium]
MIDYERDIQPVFDKHCVECHGENDPKGGVELTRRKDGFGYMQSYRSLFGVKWDDPTPQPESTAKWYADLWPEYDPDRAKIMSREKTKEWWDRVYNKGNMNPGQLIAVENHRAGRYEVSKVREFGSNHSRLIQYFLENEKHRKRLNADEWELLVTWVDALAPYSGKLLMKYDIDHNTLDKVVPVDVVYPEPFGEIDPYAAAGKPIIPEKYLVKGREAPEQTKAEGPKMVTAKPEVPLAEAPVLKMEGRTLRWNPEQGGVSGGVGLFDKEGVATSILKTTEKEGPGGAVYIIDVPEAGEYEIWARAFGEHNMADSFFVQVNDQSREVWDIQRDEVTLKPVWQKVKGRKKKETFEFKKGENKIYFLPREPNAEIHALGVCPPGQVFADAAALDEK